MVNPGYYLGTDFFGGEVRPRHRDWGNLLQESVSVPLSEHIYSSVSTDRQKFALCHYFVLQLEKFGAEAWVRIWGRSFPPTSQPPVDWTLVNLKNSLSTHAESFVTHWEFTDKALGVYRQGRPLHWDLQSLRMYNKTVGFLQWIKQGYTHAGI